MFKIKTINARALNGYGHTDKPWVIECLVEIPVKGWNKTKAKGHLGHLNGGAL